MSRALEVLGKGTPRIDALERVTGQGRNTEDIYLPGMLFARVLRSPYPHARIRGIDTSAAEALPGVMAILHCQNTDQIWQKGDSEGRRHIFNHTVRFVGDAVAAVAAVDRHTAEDALELIQVDYEELPFAVTIEDALKPGAAPIHEGGNIVETKPYQVGDLEEGFRQADFIYEQDFRTQYQNNAQMERRATVARWEGDRLTVWSSPQGISHCQQGLAADLQLPLSKVRVICQNSGGGFGSKNQNQDHDLMAVLLAKRTRKPVRLEYTRKEDFIGVHGRWPTTQHYRIGVKKDGTLTAIQMKAYSQMGGYLRGNGDISNMQVYAVPNMRKEVSLVYTNTSCSGNCRSPGYPQGFFGLESAIDEIAEQLQMDPLEFRLKNAVDGEWNGLPLTSNGLRECIRQGAAAFGWAEKRKAYAQQQGELRRGVGMAISYYRARLGPGSATVKVFPDGSIKLYVGVIDIGTGAKTVMAMIAAEALGVPLESVGVVYGDTDATPYSIGESGSRCTTHTGYAVMEAAGGVRKQLLAQAAAQLKVSPEEVDLRGGKIFLKSDPSHILEIAEVTRRNSDALTEAVATRSSHGKTARCSFFAQFAEVEVDTMTGKVRIVRFVAANDCGTVMNLLTADSQTKGGVAQAISMALREELTWDHKTGMPLNGDYHGAKVLVHPENPEVETLYVQTEDPYGPYGAKVLGEAVNVPTVAAVSNAIYHACGVRIRELPITSYKLMAALRNGASKAGFEKRRPSG